MAYARTRRKQMFIRPRGKATASSQDGSFYQEYAGMSTGFRINDFCSDVVGNPNGDNPLNLIKRDLPVLIANGTAVPTRNWGFLQTVEFSNYHIGFNGITDVGSDPSQTFLMTSALARASPFTRPDVDLWVSGTELVDLPRMIKHLGLTLHNLGRRNARDLVSNVAGAEIGYIFGWAPLIDDLRKLLKFTELVDARFKAINDLNSTSSYARTGGFLGKWTNSASAGPYNSNGVRWSAHRTTERRAWFSMSHRIFAGDRKLSIIPRDEASRIAFRRDIDLGTIWTRFPWLWLTDWFHNFRDVLYLRRNRVEYEAKNLCVMLHTKTKEVYRHDGYYTNFQDFSGVNVTPSVERVQEYKRRWVYAAPTPGIAFKPLIGSNELNILRALFTAILVEKAVGTGQSQRSILRTLSTGKGQ